MDASRSSDPSTTMRTTSARAKTPEHHRRSEAHRVHIHPSYHTAFQLLNYRRFLPFFPFFFFFFPLFPLRPPPLLRAAAAAAAVASAARTALASSARPRMTRFGGALTQGQTPRRSSLRGPATWTPRKIVGKSFVLLIKIAKKTRTSSPGSSSFVSTVRPHSGHGIV